MHNGVMNAYVLSQLLEKLTLDGSGAAHAGLSPDELLLLYCFRKLDKRDQLDILCFLSEKIAH